MDVELNVLYKYYGDHSCQMKAVSIYFNHLFEDTFDVWVIKQQHFNNLRGNIVRFYFLLIFLFSLY